MQNSEPVAKIRERFGAAQEDVLPSLIAAYREDPRSGVQALVRSAGKKFAALEKERERIRGTRAFEVEAAGDYLTTGFLCGIDEAGRGPLAGPVAAGAVILPKDSDILYIGDSKQLSPKAREALYDRITKEAVSWAVGLVSPARIDEINILQATYEAMRKAVRSLDPTPEVLIVDAVRIPDLPVPQVPVIKGDAKCYSVGAASILAKVTRDRIMEQLDEEYPEYGFAGNKGYGSADHIAALKKYGPCPVHRRSFIGHFVDPESPLHAAKSNHRAVGTKKEEAAADYLRGQGLTILEHSFRALHGEIDLIAMDGAGTLIFCEVKYRSTDGYGYAAEAVTASKQKAITGAALSYLKLHGYGEDTAVRFDVIAMDDLSVQWIRNAFPARR